MATAELRESARIICSDVGYYGAERILGIKHWTLRKWAQRFNWQAIPTHSQALDTSKLSQNRLACEEIQRELSTHSKLKLSVATSKVSEHLADMDGTALIKPAAAISAQQWSQVGDRVHGWSAERTKAPTVQVAVVQLPSDAERAERAQIDAKLDAIAARLRDTQS